MGDNQKPVIELSIPVEVPETKQEKQDDSAQHPDFGAQEEMPTVTTLLQRKKLGAAKTAGTSAGTVPLKPAAPAPTAAPTPTPTPTVTLSVPNVAPASPKPAPVPKPTPVAAAPVIAPEMPSIDVAAPVAVQPTVEAAPIEVAAPMELSIPTEVAAASAEAAPVVAPAARRRGNTGKIIVPAQTGVQPSAVRGAGEPPQFRGTLILEKLNLSAFQKMLKKHKKSANMKKLDCLGYFATRFTEMSYFEVTQPGSLQGVLGFGNSQLVSNIRSQAVTPQILPSIFEVLAQGEIFVGAVESLRAEDQQGLASLGFQTTSVIGAFPMMYKKSVTGLWLCTASTLNEIPAKELKALKKTLTDFVF